MKYNFIEIGTSDFDTLLQQSTTEIGLSIEPLQIYLDRLPNKDNVTKVNCAVSDVDSSAIDIFWIDPADIDKYTLPYWLRGCNSIITPHASSVQELQRRGLEHIYKKTQCKSLTWKTIVETYNIESVDYLKIDAEGHDCTIINNIINSNSVLPKKILFESNENVDRSTLDKTLTRLYEKGYRLVYSEFDTLVEKD